MDIRDLMKKHRETYAIKIAKLDRMRLLELKRLQAQCKAETGHDLALLQVAGDGRSCKICGYYDWSDD